MLKSIEDLSQKYEELLFKESESFILVNRDFLKILDSWWLALHFFFDRIFFQGRKDEISGRYKTATMKSLASILGPSDDDKIKKVVNLNDEGFLDFRKYGYTKKYNTENSSINLDLKNALNKNTGKGRDREMTIDVLKYISKLKAFNYNIVNYSISQIKNKKLIKHHNELKQIRQVGDKTACFYLRDVVSIYCPKIKLSKKEYINLQPIDTWVRKLSKSDRVKIVDKDASDQDIKEKLVDYCLNNGISPIKLNQGLWYLGTHSLELLLSGYKL